MGIRKECNMTPKQWYDMGESVIQEGSGVGFWRKGFVAVGEDGKVTYCNNGPCYGECANGERFRTQGIPKKSKELDYVHVMQVMLQCLQSSYSHCMFSLFAGGHGGELCCLRG